ncbi:MAG: recombination mediator RecR [Muribaculaceae bacterium]|nr:recombination mediator RecR [Muribaculaceae bacterium]
MNQTSNSILLDNAVAELGKLPGIGRKTALRLALHLLRRDASEAQALGESIINMRQNIKYCTTCHNISDKDTCDICADKTRDRTIICVVENIKDLLTVEATGEHHGLYHVLGGVISPLEGVSPGELEISSLVERVAEGGVKEVILALSPTMEGDTTIFYISRKLAPYNVEISILARGVSIGNDLEYTDELTLGRSIANRVPYK